MSINPTTLASELADFAGVKQARLLQVEDNATTPALQRIVGDPDDQPLSAFSQFKPTPNGAQLPNPLSPIQGDDIFFSYLIAGARFQAHDGSWWEILNYDWVGQVEIENVWYPRIHAQVSVYDIRRSIHSWIEPVQILVPPPPAGVDYDAQPVRVVNPKK